MGVPLLSSIISAIHLVRFVSLGNAFAMAAMLAVTFELGSLVSFIALSKSILKRLKKELLLSIFLLLFLLQAFGNVYSTFDYIRCKLIADPTWLDSFREMFFNTIDVTSAKLTLSLIIGLPIPVISLILLKSAIDYFTFSEDAPPETAALTPPEVVAAPKPVEETKPIAEKKQAHNASVISRLAAHFRRPNGNPPFEQKNAPDVEAPAPINPPIPEPEKKN